MNNLSATISSKLQFVSQLFMKGEFDKAKTALSELHQSNPSNETIIQACISLYKKVGDEKKAIDFAEKLLLLEPNNYDLVKSLVAWCLKEKQIHKAMDCYKHYLGHNNDNPQACYQLALLYQEQLEFDNAAKMFKDAISSNYQPLEECYLNLSLVYSEIRKEEQAIDCLKEVILLSPNHLIAKFNLATLYQSSGEKDLAINLYENILQQDPTFVEALVRYIHTKTITNSDTGLMRKLNRRLRSSGTSPLEKESLNYALAKASDDLKNYPAAIDAARVANELNKTRIGGFDLSELEVFVDNAILTFDHKWLNESQLSSDIEPIFIIGHFRSGSTLIEQILSGHNSVTSLGEVDYFLRYYHTHQKQFWNLSGEDAQGKLESLANEYIELTRLMSESSGRITDKRPENILFIGLIKKLFPKAKFIHTRRNLLDNGISVYFQQLNDLSTFATSLESFAQYDKLCQKLMEHWKSLFSDDIQEIYYEKLVTQPQKIAEEMLISANLDWQDECLDFERRKNYVRTASVSQVRNKIYSTSVGRGSNYFQFLSDNEKELYKKWNIS